MTTSVPSDGAYEEKADFSDIYDQSDPRAYYGTLSRLDYEIPAHGVDVFRRILAPLGPDATVLDVCCSYGVNAALLNHAVSLEDLQDHYGGTAGLPRDELLALDRRWYRERRRADAVEVIGLDAAPNAIGYAVEAGLLDDGIVADLETAPPTPAMSARLAQVDLVTVTGGIGYVGGPTFDRILQERDDPPWVTALSLRWVDFDPVAESLEGSGLVTEKVDGYLAPQRAFADADEREAVLSALDDLGLEARGEEEGRHVAELYVARPPQATRDHPLEAVLAGLESPATVD